MKCYVHIFVLRCIHIHKTHTLVTLYLGIFLITGLSISSSGSQYEGMRNKGGKLNGNRILHQSLENMIFKGKLPKDYWHRNTSRFYYSSFACEKRVTALRFWWIPRGTSEKQPDGSRGDHCSNTYIVNLSLFINMAMPICILELCDLN